MYKLAVEATLNRLNQVTIRIHHTWRFDSILHSHFFISGLQTKTFHAFLNSLCVLRASVISIVFLFLPLYFVLMKFWGFSLFTSCQYFNSPVSSSSVLGTCSRTCFQTSSNNKVLRNSPHSKHRIHTKYMLPHYQDGQIIY
jgi:hypothetical protein